MSNMQMREKLRKITEARGHSEQISEQAKQVGMTLFFLLAGIGLLALIIFSFVLFMNGRYLGASVTIALTVLIGFLLVKIYTADEIPID